MFVDNCWSGYSEYRRGKVDEKPVKSIRILNADKRRSTIDKILDILKEGRSSPFENEGLCVTGLRTIFCLQGHSWQRAQDEALSIVASAFSLLGAARPTWAEGQPDYSTPLENCRWCANELPIDVRTGGRQGKFCSHVCANSWHENRAKDAVWKDTKVLAAARETIRKSHKPTAICKACGGTFTPQRMGKGVGIYCSNKCKNIGWRVDIPSRSCTHCGKVFRPRPQHRDAIYCGSECYKAHLDERKLVRWCTFCGIKFFAGNNRAKYCTPRHRSAAWEQSARAKNAGSTGRAYRTLVGSFEISCLQCGEDFPAKSTKEKFCSNECQAINWRGRFSPSTFACQEVA